MRNRSRRLQEGLNSIIGRVAVVTPTSIATSNRYQEFADSDSDGGTGSEGYESERTATTVESLPPVTYPRYIPAAPGYTCRIRTSAPVGQAFDPGHYDNYESYSNKEMNEQKYEVDCLKEMTKK